MLDIPTMAELSAQGKMPEVLLWVGCAGSFDERAKRIVRSFAQLLIKAKVSFAVLGTEEGCTGDPAKRAGNEFLFRCRQWPILRRSIAMASRGLLLPVHTVLIR